MKRFAVSKIADINLDLKKEAARQGRTFDQQLEVMAASGEIDKSIIDPTRRNSQGQSVPAYRQVLAAAGIDLKGARSAQTVTEAFFRDDDNRILFPYYIESRYREIQNERQGELAYADLVAERIPLTGGQTIAQIPTITENASDTDGDPSRIAEGSEFPVMTIDMGDYVAYLAKFGGRLEATKEALMGARLPLFDRWLTVFARRVLRQKTRFALKLVKNGDGNNNTAPNVNNGSADLTIASLIKLRQKAAEYGASPTIVTGDTVAFGKMFELPILTNPASTAPQAQQLLATGTLPGILGMTPKIAPIPSVLDGSNQLLAIDPERGLIEFYSPDLDLVEYEYLMKRQVEAVQVSESIALGKPDNGVGVTLTLT